MSLNAHHLTQNETDDVINAVIEELDRSRDNLERDIVKIIEHNNFGCREADEYFQYALDVFCAIEDNARRNQDLDVFARGRERDFQKLIGESIRVATAMFALKDSKIERDLDDGLYNDFKGIERDYEDIKSALGRGGSRRGGRGSDRGFERTERRSSSRRSERSSSRDRGRSDRGRDRDNRRMSRDEERDNDRSSRRSSRRKDRKQSTSNHRRKGSNDRYEEQQQEEQQMSPVAVGVQTILASESNRVPTPQAGAPGAVLYNPTQHALVHTFGHDDDDYELTIEELVGVNEMENYEAHELRTRATNKSDGGRIMPIVDFTKVPDLTDAEALQSSSAIEVYDKQMDICGDGWVPSVTAMAGRINTNTSVALANINQYRLATLTTADAEIAGDLSTVKTFNNWHEVMDKLHSQAEANFEHSAVVSAFLAKLDEDLTYLVNNLISMSYNGNAMLTSFYSDWKDAKVWLRDPEQADIYRQFSGMEHEYLSHNYKVLSMEERKKLTEDKKLVPNMNDSGKMKYFWIRTKFIYINLFGEMLNETLQFSNTNFTAEVNYANTPEFYEMCERVIQLRNKRLTMASIVLSDSLGNNVSVLANKEEAPRIRARKLS